MVSFGGATLRPSGRSGRSTAASGRFVILTPGWSGSRVLAAILGASPQIRSAGSCLRQLVRDPARHLRRSMDNQGAPCVGAVVEPDDLWLVNAVDPVAFLDDLRSDGIRLLVLQRRSSLDRGLSRTLCGDGPELLPIRPAAVDPAAVAVHAVHARRAIEWFDTHVPDAPRLIFEDDLADGGGTAERFTALFGVTPWTAPPTVRPPTHERLWELVANGTELASALDSMAPACALP